MNAQEHSAPARRRKHWGCSLDQQGRLRSQVDVAAAGARQHLGFAPADVERSGHLDDCRASLPRASSPPSSLTHICRTDPYERATSIRTASRTATLSARTGAGSTTRPMSVAHPADEADVERVLAWCEEAGAAAIPFGGGTSVVGGVEPPGDRPSVTIDLRSMDRVLEVDRTSRSRAHPGRRGGGPRARGAAPRARAHPAPLPAVVRVLDARRLDRHARRRPYDASIPFSSRRRSVTYTAAGATSRPVRRAISSTIGTP